MTGRLEGKVALVTGTSGGIGRATALALAREGAAIVGSGFTNVERSRRTVQLVREAGGQMTSLEPVDLADPGQVADLVNLAGATYGRLDVLVNNASAARFGPAASTTRADWDYTVRNELDNVYQVTIAALPLLLRFGGCVVNIASISGLRGTPGSFAHSATKGGVISLTRQLAVELGPQGVRVNAVAPGVIRTPPVEQMLTNPAAEAALLQKIPLRRLGEAEDIAEAVTFLASPQASFVTGSILVADGGESAG